MKTYIGVKIVQAEPCNLGAYNERRGWKMPADEDPNRRGYYLRYPDGYQSWSPAEIFNGAYRLVSDDERALVDGRGTLPNSDAMRADSFFDRLLAEQKELTGRLEKLDAFIAGQTTRAFDALPTNQQNLMLGQQAAMHDYARILGERIAAITQGTQGQMAQPVVEQIDENVRITGGGQTEEPIPFRDDDRFRSGTTYGRSDDA